MNWICWISSEAFFGQVNIIKFKNSVTCFAGSYFHWLLNDYEWKDNDKQLITNNHLLGHICTLRFGFLSNFDWVYKKDDAVIFAKWKLVQFQHSISIFPWKWFSEHLIHFFPKLISYQTCKLTVGLSMSGLAPRNYLVK